MRRLISLFNKIRPNFVNDIVLPKKTIVLISKDNDYELKNNIINLFLKFDFKVVYNHKKIHNIDDLHALLLKTSNNKGIFLGDVFIVDIDEMSIKDVLNDFKPNYLIINNLDFNLDERKKYRDIIMEDLKKSLSSNTHLIVNLDNYMIGKILFNHTGKITSFLPKIKRNHALDFLEYLEQKQDFYLTNINDNNIKINNTYNIGYNLYNDNSIHNNVAIFTISRVFKLNIEKTIEFIKKTVDYMNIRLNDKGCLCLRAEDDINEYNKMLKNISENEGLKTIVIESNSLNLSWNIDFNYILRTKLEKIITFGDYAYDMALNANYLGVDSTKLKTAHDSDDLKSILLDNTKGDIYILSTKDISYIFK